MAEPLIPKHGGLRPDQARSLLGSSGTSAAESALHLSGGNGEESEASLRRLYVVPLHGEDSRLVEGMHPASRRRPDRRLRLDLLERDENR